MNRIKKIKTPFFPPIIKNVLLVIVLLFILSGNFLTFIDFGCEMQCCKTETNSCCAVQEEQEHTCEEGFISCSPKLLLLIPLVLLEKHQDNYIPIQNIDIIESEIMEFDQNIITFVINDHNTGPPEFNFPIPLRI